MKRTLLLMCCLILVISFWAMTYSTAQDNRNKPVSDSGGMKTVLNPSVSSRMANRIPLAPRPDTLDGKTIYMVAINWGGTDAASNVFEEMRSWFTGNMPGVKTVIKMKKGGYGADDPDLWEEIRERKADGVILGVSG